MCRKFFFWYLLLLFLPISTFSQELSKEEKKAARKAKKQEKIDKGQFMILPLVGPANTLELVFEWRFNQE